MVKCGFILPVVHAYVHMSRTIAEIEHKKKKNDGKIVSVQVLSRSCGNELLVVDPMAALSSIYNPEDEGQHDGDGHYEQAHVYGLRVLSEARAMAVPDVCEHLSHECTVHQLQHERPVPVQPVAHVHCGHHLGVEHRG